MFPIFGTFFKQIFTSLDKYGTAFELFVTSAMPMIIFKRYYCTDC